MCRAIKVMNEQSFGVETSEKMQIIGLETWNSMRSYPLGTRTNTWASSPSELRKLNTVLHVRNTENIVKEFFSMELL